MFGELDGGSRAVQHPGPGTKIVDAVTETLKSIVGTDTSVSNVIDFGSEIFRRSRINFAVGAFGQRFTVLKLSATELANELG